jgi:type IV secretion system protein VirB11
MLMTNQALDNYAAPIYKLIEPEGVTELCYNGDESICFIEKYGEWTSINLKDLIPNTRNYFQNLTRMVASYNSQDVSNKMPLLSGTMPQGQRIQIVHPPCANYAFSIRKPTTIQFSLDDYKERGAFDHTALTRENIHDPEQIELRELYDKKDFYSFLKKAVLCRKNIIISGGTSTGKTTFFNALVKLIPHSERLISIEDSHEIVLDQPNKLHLISPRNSQNASFVTLLEACLRLRPDRIMAAEIRGAEAFAYLRAINTGHPGSITTVHADNPKAAFQQLYMMLSQAKLGLEHQAVEIYVKNVIDIVIQLKNADGKRYISEIYYEDNK